MRLAPLVAIAVALPGCHSKEGASQGSPCASAHDCGGGLVCVAGACAGAAAKVGACAAGAPRLVGGAAIVAPDPGTTCATAIMPAAPSVNVQALGQHTVGERLSFDVPAGTWSVSIVSQAVPGTTKDAVYAGSVVLPNSVVPTDVRAPDGRLFYTDLPADQPSDRSGYPDYTGFLAYYGGLTPVSGSFTFPNTSAGLDVVRSSKGGLPAGAWTMTVNDLAAECLVAGCSGGSATGKYDVQVVTRAGPSPFASAGTLDFDVYLAASDPAVAVSTPLLAADAPTRPDLQRLFTSLGTVLASAGLCVGTVTFHDLPDWARTRYASVNVDATGPCDDLSQLFTLAQAPSASVHLFLVDDLTETSGSQKYRVVGIDGSIPGPSGVPGTINGGTVVPVWDLGHGQCGSAIDVARCGSDRMAYIAAHEAGHWLGLYHTTERYGSLFDPLSDTPACRCSVCAPLTDRASCAENAPRDSSTSHPAEPVSMIGDWCARDGSPDCGGAQNLMFWLLDDARSRGALSPQQAEVMRLNPAVR